MARKLRTVGHSIGEIATKLGVARSSVSVWVRDVKLGENQLKEISQKSIAIAVIERRRATRLARENYRRQLVVDRAKQDIVNISGKSLFFVGIALYWAEGSKTRRGIVEFCNSDPRLIKIMMRFFEDVCGIHKEKFRGHIHLHPHLDSTKAKKYWGKISTIPLRQFFKTSQQYNKSSKNKRDSLPFGTFSIYICSTELFLKLKGWREGLYNKIV